MRDDELDDASRRGFRPRLVDGLREVRAPDVCSHEDDSSAALPAVRAILPTASTSHWTGYGREEAT
jgi:hypothetical protein